MNFEIEVLNVFSSSNNTGKFKTRVITRVLDLGIHDTLKYINGSWGTGTSDDFVLILARLKNHIMFFGLRLMLKKRLTNIF